jgi:hypothetical protein
VAVSIHMHGCTAAQSSCLSAGASAGASAAASSSNPGVGSGHLSSPSMFLIGFWRHLADAGRAGSASRPYCLFDYYLAMFKRC